MTSSNHISLTGRISLVVAGVAVLSLYLSGLLDRVDSGLQDRVAKLQSHAVSSNIVIVEIDSYSLKAIDQWPWDRRLYAQVLKNLQGAGANSVFIDIDFSTPTSTEADAALAQALAELAQTTRVRLPLFIQPQSTSSTELTTTRPLPSFSRHVELVSVNIQPSSDGLVRRVNAGFVDKDQYYASAWNAISRRLTQTTYLDYSISPNSFEYLSFADLLYERSVDVEQLKGKDILIGSTAIELGDVMPVPVYKAVPGAVLQGIAIETLLRGGLHVLSPTATVLLQMITFALAALLLVRLNWYLGLSLVIASIFIVTSAQYISSSYMNLLLPCFSLFLVWPFAYIASLIGKVEASAFRNLWLQLNLMDRDQLLASIFSASNDSILCVDPNGFISSANARCKEIFGCASQDLVGRSLGEIMPVAREGIKDLSLDPFETNIIDVSFRKIPIEVCISPLKIANKISYTLAIRNLRERKEKEMALNYAVTHDKLTGLLNRVHYFDLAEEAIASGGVCTLLKLDIDYFNEINEIYGHDFGDRVLKILSSRIIDLVDSRALVGRIGKDDFAILVRNKSNSEVKLIAEKLLAAMNRPFVVEEQEIDIFCHIGAAQAADSRSNIEELLRLSNTALQSAKQKGLEFDFCESRSSVVEPQRLNIIGAIRKALLDDSFDLAYQPKIELESGKPIGCEVLLRPPVNWNQEVPVFKLIEVAETTRLISDLTLGVVEKVLAIEDKWQNMNLPRQISVNLSLGLLANNQFIANLIQKIDQSKGYFQFEFEITETSLSNNWQQSISNIDRLLTRNVTLAIDDFGTGYSSLAYLRDLRAKVLKIDKSFVSNIHLKLENQSIVHSTIKMAHELGMTVVAEGIEQKEEKDFLAESGCDIGQGYLFARPMYYPQFTSWLSSRTTSNVVLLPRKSDLRDN